MEEGDIHKYKPFGLPSLLKELNKATSILRQCVKCRGFNHVSALKFARYHVLNCINDIKRNESSSGSLTSTDDLKRDIFLVQMDAEYEEIKISHIRKEWLQHQHTLAELQECYFRKARLLSVHSTYCSAQGATFCSLLAILLREEDALQSFINENDHLISFVRIADDFLTSFSITYSVEPPLEDSPDYKYVTSLYTCLVLFAADVAGRIFLISESQCQDCIWDIIHCIARLHHSSLRRLKILIWTFLYQLTNDPDGILMLQGCSTLLVQISSCLRDDYDGKMCKYALTILERLTSTVSNMQYLKEIENNIDMRQLRRLSDPEYKEVNLLPKRIFRNMGRAANDFLYNSARGDIKNAKSSTVQCRCKHSGDVQQLHPKPRRDNSSSSSTSSELMAEKETQVRPVPQSHKHGKCSKRPEQCKRRPGAPANDRTNKDTDLTCVSNEERQLKSIKLNESKESLDRGKDMALCTCLVKSEKQLTPWTPEKSMISYLAEKDRRIPTARIVNRVTNTRGNKRQRIISRIKISGLSFKS